MRDVLMVCRDVYLASPEDGKTAAPRPMCTVSVDEKPGVQAIGSTAPDLPPVPGEQPAWSRDHEYVRHGTVSILAALDLHTGQRRVPPSQPRVFALLERLDGHYPPDAVVHIVLDNHSAHVSRETMAWLATRPGRFEYVHTPKHGSWLNLIECAFSKMARTFLRHIRVASVDELKARILQGIDEMNEAPVQFRWRALDLELSRDVMIRENGLLAAAASEREHEGQQQRARRAR